MALSDLPFFRRSGLAVRLPRSERSWMPSCVCGAVWLAGLLSPLLSSLPLATMHMWLVVGVERFLHSGQKRPSCEAE